MSSRRGRGEGSIRKRADGRWEATITLPAVSGRRRRKSYFGKTKTEVTRKMQEGQRKVEQGLPLPSERETLATYMTSWLVDAAAPRLRPRTLASYQMIVKVHLIPELGTMKLAQLQPAAIRAYMNRKLAAGLAPRTVQYHHAVLRKALTDAEGDGLVSRNVARLVSSPKVERAEVRPLTSEEARVLLDAIAEQRLAPLYACAIALGLRQGELLGLTWDALDLERGTLTVRHTLQRYAEKDNAGAALLGPNGKPTYAYHLDAPKTDKSRRTLGLPVELVMLLRAHRSQQVAERLKAGPAWQGEQWNLVFCTEAGKPMPGNHLTHSFQKLLAELGLPRQRFHDLRHAAATYMIAQGVDLRVIMEVLGHSQIHVTANTYAHVRIEMTRAAVASVGALLAR